MRKFLFVCFLVLGFVGVCQEIEIPVSHDIGLQAGMQYGSSYIWHTQYRNVFLQEMYVPGFHLGLIYRNTRYSSRKFLNTGFQTGLIYFQKGWEQDMVLSSETPRTSLNYLVMPIDAIIYAGNPDNKIYILLGLYGEYLVGYESATEPQDIATEESFYTYDANRDNKFGYGFKGGLGYQKGIGSGSIFIEGSFSYSISNFLGIDRRSDDFPDISNLYSITASVGYLFSL